MEDKKLTPEQLIKIYVGKCGFWQIRSLLILAMVKVPSAWQMGSILFTAIEPNDYWCAPPEELSHVDVNDWKNMSHPREIDHKTGKETWNPCYIYALNYTDMFQKNSILPIFDNVPLQRCTRFKYDSVLTITTKWDLVCDREILISISQLFYLLGLLMGTIAAPIKINKHGPRKVMIAGMIFQILFGVMSAYSPFLEMKFVTRFLVACSCSNMFAASFNICQDIVQSEERIIFACCFETFWSLGIISLAVWAYILPNWIELQVALSIPTFIILFFFKWIPESPKWLLMKEEYSSAEDLLKRAAKLNGRDVPILDFKNCLDDRSSDKSTWLEFVRNHNFMELATLHVSWAFTYLTYYGSLVNLKSLGDNLKIITILAGCTEIVGVLTGIYLIFRSRRKWLSVGILLVLVGISTNLCWLLPKHQFSRLQRESAIVVLGMTIRLAAATSLTLLTATSADAFQPCFRGTSSYSFSVFAKILLLVAPFVESTALYGANASLTTYGAFLIVIGISTLIFSYVHR